MYIIENAVTTELVITYINVFFYISNTENKLGIFQLCN